MLSFCQVMQGFNSLLYPTKYQIYVFINNLISILLKYLLYLRIHELHPTAGKMPIFVLSLLYIINLCISPFQLHKFLDVISKGYSCAQSFSMNLYMQTYRQIVIVLFK